MMSETQRGGRRHSARLADKEDAPLVNGVGYEPGKQPPKNAASAKGGKGGSGVKIGAKRKPSEPPLCDFVRLRARAR